MNDEKELHDDCCEHDHDEHGACDCEHEHHHDHDHCSCEHEHHHDHCGCGDDHCSCGDNHCDGHGHCSCAACSEEEVETTSKDIVFLIISAVLIGVSFLIPAGIFRTLVQAAATLLIGWKMFWEGLKGLVHFSLDEMTLMTVAVVAAFAIGEGFEGDMVTILFQIGELFENRAVMKSRKRIDALVSIVPENANRLNSDGSVTEVPASEVEPGDLLLIPGRRPGAAGLRSLGRLRTGRHRRHHRRKRPCHRLRRQRTALRHD